MLFSLYAKIAIAIALAVALAGATWKIRHDGIVAGRAEVQQKWDKIEKERTDLALATSETYRLRERAAQKGVADVDKQLQAAKALRAAAEYRVAGGVRELSEALARASVAPGDTATASRTDDARDTIIRECTSALATLDGLAGGRADKIAGLQGYAAKVCVMP